MFVNKPSKSGGVFICPHIMHTGPISVWTLCFYSEDLYVPVQHLPCHFSVWFYFWIRLLLGITDGHHSYTKMVTGS